MARTRRTPRASPFRLHPESDRGLRNGLHRLTYASFGGARLIRTSCELQRSHGSRRNQPRHEFERVLNGTLLPAGQTAEVGPESALQNIFQHTERRPFIGAS